MKSLYDESPKKVCVGGYDRRGQKASQPHNRRMGQEIGDKGGHLGMEGLVPSHALRYGLREAVAK